MIKINLLAKRIIEFHITLILQAIARNDLEEQKVDAINCDSESANKYLLQDVNLLHMKKSSCQLYKKIDLMG